MKAKLTIKDKGLNRLMALGAQLQVNPYVKVGVLGAAGQARVKTTTKKNVTVRRDKQGRVTGARGGVAGRTTTTAGLTNSRGAGVIDNVGLAVVHEFGVPRKGIPSRPFLRSTFDAKKDDWNKLLARMIVQAVAGKLTVQQALGLLGQRASADVKRRITSGNNFAPNAPSTIARKGSSRPLIDTGRLVGSISYEVKEGGAR